MQNPRSSHRSLWPQALTLRRPRDANRDASVSSKESGFHENCYDPTRAPGDCDYSFGSLPFWRRPLPIADFRHVLAIPGDILPVLDELVLELLL